MTTEPGMTWFIVYKHGIFYFRLPNGYGLSVSTYRDHRPLFSERNGINKPIFRTKWFRVFVLRPSHLRPHSRPRLRLMKSRDKG
jgi:hypothetical protein